MFLLIAGFICLGAWQLTRLSWKSELISSAQRNSSLPALSSLPSNVDSKLFYTHVNFKGQILHSEKKVVTLESYKQKYYYRVLAPVKIENRLVMVDFGITSDKNVVLPEEIDSQGILFNFDRKNIFYPKNNPDKLVWYNMDYGTIKDHLGLGIEPYYIKIVPGHSISDEFIVKPFATSYRNDHLMYAITWFLLAFFCSIILYFRIKQA